MEQEIENKEEIISSEQMEKLNEMKQRSVSDIIEKGRLYNLILNIISMNNLKEKFEIEEDKDFEKAVENYNSGNFGKWISESEIRNYILKNKEKINKVINAFFTEFKEEF